MFLFLFLVFCIAKAMACLVQLASARRSLFSNLERSQYLEQLVKGVQGILESPQVSHALSDPWLAIPTLSSQQPLSDSGCYHEFCRLLVRLKSNYQMGELMRLENYPQFLQLVAKFTISSLQVSLVECLLYIAMCMFVDIFPLPSFMFCTCTCPVHFVF